MGDEGQDRARSVIREFMAQEDAAEVAAILAATPEATLWTAPDLLRVRELSGVMAFVSLDERAISGIVIGRTAADEAEILNLAVRQENRRRGVGKQLVSKLLEACRQLEVSRVFLEVRESNAGAFAFYEWLGFRTAGKRRDYYQDPKEAALVMERRL